MNPQPFVVYLALDEVDLDFILKFDPASELQQGQGAGPSDLTLAYMNFVQTVRDLLNDAREDL